MLLAVLTVFTAGCATQRFTAPPPGQAGFVARGITQQEGDVVVTAAVPSPAEIEVLFGVDLFKDDIQPVWLEVENRGDRFVRIVP